MYLHLQEVLLSLANVGIFAQRWAYPALTVTLCSVVSLGRRGWGQSWDWSLTDALEAGSGPVGGVCGLVKHALGEAGRAGLPPEARVTHVPLPGVQGVTLDPDSRMFNRHRGGARGACESAKRGEMKSSGCVKRPSPGSLQVAGSNGTARVHLSRRPPKHVEGDQEGLPMSKAFQEPLKIQSSRQLETGASAPCPTPPSPISLQPLRSLSLDPASELIWGSHILLTCWSTVLTFTWLSLYLLPCPATQAIGPFPQGSQHDPYR